MNFLDADELSRFLSCVVDTLEEGGIFLADINTKHGFVNVADGTMSNDSDDEFLSVDAQFSNDELHTKFTLFVKDDDGRFTKYQDTIVQHFHKVQVFQKIEKLKLIEKQTFSLYDTEDKTLLIFKKR